MKIVFDTNVVMSASFWGGKPAAALAVWARGRCEAVVSPQILSEYFETAQELEPRYPGRTRTAWVEMLARSAQLVFPLDRLHGALKDPDDAIFLECAAAGEAEAIVSGDKKHLLRLREWRGIKLLSVSEFLAGSAPK